MGEGTTARGQWGSKAGFVLAAAGSAVGLGNLWKFPYITGQNGGGAFVLIYLVCIIVIGFPIMVGEVFVGKLAQKAPVGAFGDLTPRGSPWKLVGALGVLTGFIILSFYSVVAGWAMHFIYLSVTGAFSSAETPEELARVTGYFAELYANPGVSLGWHTVFMALTVGIVIVGVQKGVERASRVLMPALFLMLMGLVAYASTLSGFGRATDFVFGFHTDALTGEGVLEALGHSFFTLSLGMGAMITYGSYMRRGDGVVMTSLVITALDTAVALMACLALFPITFTFDMQPAAGPGLVFSNMPAAFSQMPGGSYLAAVFFLLLTFAALTSAISLLEVVASYLIDEHGWSRWSAVSLTGGLIFLFGIPSALSGGTELFGDTFVWLTSVFGGDGKNWMDSLDYLASNWMLPLGGLGISLFAGWRLDDMSRREAIAEGSPIGATVAFYKTWLWVIRLLAPVAIILVILHAIGVL